MMDLQTLAEVNAQAEREHKAGNLHDDVLDCLYALVVDQTSSHCNRLYNKATKALDALHAMAVKVEK